MATESSKTDVYMMSTVRGLVEYITAKTQLAQNAAPTLAPRSPTLATGAAILGQAADAWAQPRSKQFA